MQTIHMKFQGLFSEKNTFFFLECHLLQILLGALRVKRKRVILHKYSQQNGKQNSS